ncbi:lipopolysaccharide assembly protein LapA domain-containing protein [Marinobacterium rhizophilum]|uniref:lipopolysaccharide assembly protein LapA domain-containing protein n=1 Tax=Marinobacterium rhizophilum TaxID=420402 RepID=UPI0003A703FD|nr:LapA family protein [Marinobacterium rhizophilum]
MRWLRTLLLIILCLVFLFVGILFTIHNTDKVSIDLILVTLPQASLSLWLIAAFVCGGVLGLLLSSVAILGLKTRLRSARKRLSIAQHDLEQQRALVTKDSV